MEKGKEKGFRFVIQAVEIRDGLKWLIFTHNGIL
jgi:hypothetical protein